MERPYKTWVEVSRSALAENAATLKRAAGMETALMAVVKSNAYGHGIPETVKALAKAPVDWFGVDALREAELVRKSGTKKPVLILGYTPFADAARAVKQGFSQIVYNRENVARLAKAGTRRRPAKIHLKLETGTSRQGILAQDLPAFADYLKRLKTVEVEGVSTHYANIEDTTDSAYAMGQREKFDGMVKLLAKAGVRPPMVHSACSAAVLLFPETHYAMVRSGIALYGLWPSKETKVSAAQKGRAPTLRPALSWKTIVAQVKDLPEGSPVSYGLTERLARRSKIAVIPVGYWDGFDRGLSSVGRVLIRGRRAKVLGRVCMNMCVVDVTDIPGVKIEDEVTLIGRQGTDAIAAEDLAGATGTINYEIVTRINPLIPRILTA
ncbi:MAG TPA: alanine racemase [Candidatus Eisenbacteria bacterium]|nr:alanine racemase [Candidatus Eisenbacteria bacterium]